MMNQPFFRQLRKLTSSGCKLAKKHQLSKDESGHQLDIKPTIGLEVHAQLKINSKLFSQGSNRPDAPPNVLLDFLDISLPGTLPKLNLAAIESSILLAQGLNCKVQDVIHFDRKNYFYSDMPAGYQITQYNNPIAKNGCFDFIVSTYHHTVIAHTQNYDITKYALGDRRASSEQFEPYMKRSQIKQLQLEQDSAKTLSHSIADSTEHAKLIDYNRSGSALVEIVFEPDLKSADEASSLIRDLIFLLRALKVCDCELQKGSLRVDANVSIYSINGETIPRDIGKRVELKNLNSLRSVNRGILAEIQRQAVEIASGGRIIQESRCYESRSNQTIPLRLKEDAIDYRYMPEPNLPPLRIDPKIVQRQQSYLSTLDLPQIRRARLRENHNLDYRLIVELQAEPGLDEYFMEVVRRETQESTFDSNSVADFLIYAVHNLKCDKTLPIDINLMKKDGEFWTKLSPEKMQIVFDLLFEDKISFSQALSVLKFILSSDGSITPDQAIRENDLYLVKDREKIAEACRELFKGMKNISKKYIKTGHQMYLRMMLEKLHELYDGKLSVHLAIECINRLRDERLASMK